MIPHSHNDPGWLKTFEQYFELKSKTIINNIVNKLQEYPNMTFIWSEVAFLNSWWELAHPLKQKVRTGGYASDYTISMVPTTTNRKSTL